MVSPLRALSLRVGSVAALALLGGPVAAQTPAPLAPPPPAAVRAAPRAPVPVRRPQRAPRTKRQVEVALPEGTPVVSSPEFARLEDGKTRIWVEVSARVDVVEKRLPGQVVYHLQGAGVLRRTSQLPLQTALFSTPVERVQLAPEGADVDLVITLREATEPAYHVVETPRGMVLQVDLPRSQTFGRDDEVPDSRPSSERSSASRSLGTTTTPDQPPPAADAH